VLSTSGSTGEMLIYHGNMYFTNVEFTDEEREAGYYDGLGTTKVYLWDSNKFSAVPTNLTTLQWRKKAEKVIQGQVSLNGRMAFGVCGKTFTVIESYSTNFISWNSKGNQHILFKPRPDKNKIGW
jgi:hypothetical protein